jgi:hypothetical protein
MKNMLKSLPHNLLMWCGNKLVDLLLFIATILIFILASIISLIILPFAYYAVKSKNFRSNKSKWTE